MFITAFGLLWHSFWIESICRLTDKILFREANLGKDFGARNYPHAALRNFVRDFLTKFPKCNFVLAWHRIGESVWKTHPKYPMQTHMPKPNPESVSSAHHAVEEGTDQAKSTQEVMDWVVRALSSMSTLPVRYPPCQGIPT